MSDEQQGPIELHPDFPDILDEIEKYGDWTKADLVRVLYDQSGEGEPKYVLQSYSRGKLLAMLIDGNHGGTCQ